jgi:hypothetical protein
LNVLHGAAPAHKAVRTMTATNRGILVEYFLFSMSLFRYSMI